MILITKTSDQTRQRGHTLSCVCVCVFIELPITAQSGLVIYSFYATAFNPPGGYFSEHILSLKCACIQSQLLAILPRLSASARREIWRRKRGKGWTGLFLSNTWVKVVARRLAQQIDREIRQTESTTAHSPCNLPLQTQQFRHHHHHRTVQHTVQYCSSGVVITPPSPFSIQSMIVLVSRLHPPIFPSQARELPQAIGPGVEQQS